ncbi:hypothetical protein N9X03_02950 [Planktomarina temperata]|nr:hypothetical protein [Planktomarina temperata]
MKYVANIANWILGVLFFIVSLGFIITFSIVPGLFLLIASLTLMPISRRFVLPKINEKMSPMIRGAFVSILFIGFVVSVQPNEAQLLERKELRLAEEAALEEAALLEQKKVAKAAGFLSVEEYEEAKSVEMPTKELYDRYLEQKAELRIAEEKRKAEEAEKARLAAAAEEKLKAEKAEKARLAAEAEEKQKLLAANAEARELFELTEHISQGGSYAFIEISDINAELFSGKSCSEALGIRASLKPVKGSHRFGFVVNGVSGEIAEISTVFSFGDNAPTYKMPKGCNIFSSPMQVEQSCGLDDPKYIKEIYELNEATGIAAKFGRLKRIGGDNEENTWKVITRDDGETLTSAVVNLQRMAVYQNKPYKIDLRTYICHD